VVFPSRMTHMSTSTTVDRGCEPVWPVAVQAGLSQTLNYLLSWTSIRSVAINVTIVDTSRKNSLHFLMA